MDIVILGAGYGGLRAALDLDERLGDEPDVTLTLVDKHDYHQFRTELHRVAAGTSTFERVRIPLAELLRETAVQTVKGEVTAIDVADHRVSLRDGRQLPFDRLVVALGGEPEYFNIPGVAEFGLTLRSLNSARVIRQHVEETIRRAAAINDPRERAPYLTIVIGGGGLTGVELATELADRCPRLVKEAGLPAGELRLLVVEAAPDILAGFDPRLVEIARRRMHDRGIEVRLGTPIQAVERGAVVLAGGERIPTHTFIWSGGVRGNRVVEAALTTKARGRAVVNAYLQSVDSPDVFCIGDCALALNPRTQQPVAPTAQNAIAQGRVAARNLCALYHGEPLIPYTAQNFGVVASLGRGFGLAHLDGYGLAGLGAAVLKDLVTWKYLFSIGGTRFLWRGLGRAGSEAEQPSPAVPK